MNAKTQLSQLNSQERAALAQKIRTRLSAAAAAPVDTPAPDHDVCIIGGGVAALTLALELRRARPVTRILIVEPNTHPVPEITHTVGESTVEVSAQYLRDRLGLADHLQSAQIRKMGLRMFFSHNGNTDIAERVELGSSSFVPQVTYQIDRGRLENELYRRCAAEGVAFTGGRVRSVDFGAAGSPHTVSVQSGQAVTETTARWVVDASGRNRTLPRRLDLRRDNGHACNAAWFRVATEIDVGTWSDDPAWHGRLLEGDRALSTNHLMGEGYWVWLIRLASGATSVGIVADPAFHPFDGFNTWDKARQWLGEREPQCAAVLAEHEHLVKDFKVMKHYSHSVAKVFDGRDRWCLTGDAGIFLDPLYSSGLDLVAIGNGLVTDLVTRDLDGDDVVARSAISDSLFRSLTDMWLAIYRDQYTLMGSPTVMSAKIIWDIAFYWGFVGLLYSNDRFVRVADQPDVVPHLQGMIDLSNRMQAFFREWAGVESGDCPVKFVDLYARLNFMETLHIAMMGEAESFSEQFGANATLLRQVAGQLVEAVLLEHSGRFADDDVMAQVQAWQRDSLLAELRSVYRDEQSTNPISEDWLLGTARVP
ncbi:Lycopene cyclase protein [Mycolicibacterium chubuense NBB4]|uniref:Lycopene cyclase protein n=1 Tax=Mycolicibacterium chubuense (strain NBB4) TaxID=710421 RepID=I4BP62_MYCCN|nr:tryptophan 7-halogenase [Mycolicibacterium chubuense]AFM19069.1 Lycopene cyclase protein [Mycolicibacterium chubuense NBB4]